MVPGDDATEANCLVNAGKIIPFAADMHQFRKGTVLKILVIEAHYLGLLLGSEWRKSRHIDPFGMQILQESIGIDRDDHISSTER